VSKKTFIHQAKVRQVTVLSNPLQHLASCRRSKRLAGAKNPNAELFCERPGSTNWTQGNSLSHVFHPQLIAGLQLQLLTKRLGDNNAAGFVDRQSGPAATQTFYEASASVMGMKPTRRAALASTVGAALALAQRAENSLPITPNLRDAVIGWIRDTAIRLSTPVAGHGFDDMAPLQKIVGDARIVALGEASHGTREFFQLKHRMLEFLVTEMGFSIFSIEANMPEAYRLNDFVLNGEGDPAKLIKGMYVWLWDTQEVLDMVLWMREYNKSGKGRVQFTGFDMQTPTVASAIVRDFVAKTDEEYVPVLGRALEMVRASLKMEPSEREGVAAEWEKVVAHLETLRPRLGLEWAIQNARIVRQCMHWAANLAEPQVSMAVRDTSMAANVKWILDQSKGAKIVLWAHNFHVMTGPLFPDAQGPGDSLGAELRKLYADKLVTFGFAFNQGSFRARSMNGDVQTFTLEPLPAGSLDAMLAGSGIPLFALDLRAAPKTGPVAQWLGVKHPTRNIMEGFSEDRPNFTIFEQVVTERYDCLLFVDKTTATRPNPKAD
jgi:erythromycin esterase